MRVPVIVFSVLIPTLLARRTIAAASPAAFTQKPRSTGDEEKYDDVSQTENSESVIKEKLVNLVLSSKNEIASRIKKIDSIHDVYKSDRMYKIGYLVSFVNKLYQRLSDAYANIEEHKYTWNTMQILDAYEEVKYSIDYLREVLRVLNTVVSSNFKMLKSEDGTRLRKSVINVNKGRDVNRGPFDLYHPFTKGINDKKMPIHEISWSYYDDSLMA